MRRQGLAAVASAVALLMVSSSLASAQTEVSDDQTAVLGAEAAISAGQVANDVDAVERGLAEGYTFTLPDGVIVSRQTFLDNMRQWWKPTAVLNTNQTVRVMQDTAIVTGRATYRWTSPTQGDEQAIEQYTDTYHRQDGVWRRVASHSSCIEGRCV